VNLKEADLTLAIEIRENWSFVYCYRYLGPGGLPSGTAEPGLSLLSGGIDSPVASYMAMKRGMRLDYLTFDSFPYTPEEAVDKVAKLTMILNEYQKYGRLFVCNLSEAQKIIRDQFANSYRTIYYRRLMMRVASAIASRIKAQALVTGEAIGQVASQTIPNLTAINGCAEQVVIRPLICMDKEEVIAIARCIGTMDISKVPCADSCTVFAPREAATSVKMDRILRDEGLVNMDDLVNMSLDATYFLDLETKEQIPWTEAPRRN